MSSSNDRRSAYVILALVAATVGGIAVWRNLGEGSGQSAVSVNVPASLTAMQEDGQKLFGEFCAECHGKTAGGTANGPPLVHQIYRPSHHADYGFVLAVQNGVRAHHWGFGDMPPVPGIGERQISSIIAFVRALQKENGIQ